MKDDNKLNIESPFYSFYEIKKGDSLYKISKEYNVNTKLLAELNGLNLDDYIYPGQTILIPKRDVSYYITKDGDTLDIGGKTLLFKMTPYLHTAETMITYCVEDKILFPCDIFSTHLTAKEHFSSKSNEDIKEDFLTYYKLIMEPHRKYIRPLIDILKDLDIEVIAPSHGYILDENIQSYIDIYDKYSKETKKGKKATIVYTTMRNTTKKIAEKFKSELENEDIEVYIFNADKSTKEDILASIKESDSILFGT